MKRILPLVFFVLSINALHSQTIDSSDFEAEPTSIYDVIRMLGTDTVMFYYSEQWNLVKPVCATVFRISRVDTVKFNFTGKFTDYYTYDSTVAIEGNYANGIKAGKFNIYFPNGQLEQSGNYVNNKKSGIWEYYYPSGIKRQVFDFRDNEILILEFWNEEGMKLVDEGNGQYFTYESLEEFKKTSGEVLNGRKHGTWKNIIVSRNMTTNIENYKEGKLLKGKMISVAGGIEPYKNRTYCPIEFDPTFLRAEKFLASACIRKQQNTWEFSTYPGGRERFMHQISEKLVLEGSSVKRGVIKVQMTIDYDGKMTNFIPVSSTGYEWELIRVLRTMDVWTPTKVNGEPTTQAKLVSFEIR